MSMIIDYFKTAMLSHLKNNNNVFSHVWYLAMGQMIANSCKKADNINACWLSSAWTYENYIVKYTTDNPV